MRQIKGDFGRPARVDDPEKQAAMDAAYIKRLERALSASGEDPRWSAVTALAGAGVLTVGVLAALVGLLVLLANQRESGPESALSLVFVSAAVILILVVCTLSIVFKRLRLDDRGEAMGLPRGSVRAVIALMLILLFFIAAIYLFTSTQRNVSGERKLQGLSATQFASVDPAEIISSSQTGSGSSVTYDVTLLPASANTGASDDIAKQLVTTVGTLVTAVAAFYFGANSVTTAMGSKKADGGEGAAGSPRPGGAQPSPGTGSGTPTGASSNDTAARGSGTGEQMGARAGAGVASHADGPPASAAGTATPATDSSGTGAESAVSGAGRNSDGAPSEGPLRIEPQDVGSGGAEDDPSATGGAASDRRSVANDSESLPERDLAPDVIEDE